MMAKTQAVSTSIATRFLIGVSVTTLLGAGFMLAAAPDYSVKTIYGVCGSRYGDCLVGAPATLDATRWICQMPEAGASVSCPSGSGGGTNPPSTANGRCGSAHGRTLPSLNLSFTNPDLCATGEADNLSVTLDPAGWGWACYVSFRLPGVPCHATRLSTVPAVPPSPIAGSCGMAHGGPSFNTPPPPADRCLIGNPTAITQSTTAYTWSCLGINGGASSPLCRATRVASSAVVAGRCGTAHGIRISTPPTTNTLCTSGTPSSVTLDIDRNGGDDDYYVWNCWGINSYGVDRCQAPTTYIHPPLSLVDASCGNFFMDCLVGTAQRMSGTRWFCNNSPGASMDCPSRERIGPPAPVNGACGTAARQYSATATAFSGTPCSVGTPTPANPPFPTATTPTIWTCSGTNNGNPSPPCRATRVAATSAPTLVNGTCGPAHRRILPTAPTLDSDLCATGFHNTVVSSDTEYFWICSRDAVIYNYSNQQYVSCGAFKANSASNPGACGTSNGITTPTAPTTNLCRSGTTAVPNPVNAPPLYYTWECRLNYITLARCLAFKAVTIGNCGSAAKQYLAGAIAFKGALCSSPGDPNPLRPPFPTVSRPTTWTCAGTNGGGSSAPCRATLAAATAPVPPPPTAGRPRPVGDMTPARIDEAYECGERYGVPPILLLGQIAGETDFDPTDIGEHGESQGLTQISPEAFNWCLNNDSYISKLSRDILHPKANVCCYAKQLMRSQWKCMTNGVINWPNTLSNFNRSGQCNYKIDCIGTQFYLDRLYRGSRTDTYRGGANSYEFGPAFLSALGLTADQLRAACPQK